MTTALAISNGEWLTLKSSKGFLKPFTKDIELGEYNVEGLVHLTNPSLRFSELNHGTGLTLRVGKQGACELVSGMDVLGWLPKREGGIFNRLLAGGKRLTAIPIKMAADEFEPRMTIKVMMEEF